MPFRQPIVIAYDVTDRRNRAKVLRILKAWRLDGQKSVHECRLTTSQAEELFLQLSDWIAPESDHLLFAWLQPHRRVLCRGLGRNMIREKLWIAG
jgi:CRISPR-associated protein Cas2